jgi:hypothetical protein
MNTAWAALLGGLVGALLGSASNVIVAVMNQRAERRREQARLALQAASEEMKHAMRLGGPRAIPPLSHYFFVNLRILRLAEENKLSPESLREVFGEMEKLSDETEKYTRRAGIHSSDEPR